MDCDAATPDPSDDATLSQVNKQCQTNRAFVRTARAKVRCAMFNSVCAFVQDALNGEEDLSEEEKVRQRAERRKAKRKVGAQILTPLKDPTFLVYCAVCDG